MNVCRIELDLGSFAVESLYVLFWKKHRYPRSSIKCNTQPRSVCYDYLVPFNTSMVCFTCQTLSSCRDVVLAWRPYSTLAHIAAPFSFIASVSSECPMTASLPYSFNESHPSSVTVVWCWQLATSSHCLECSAVKLGDVVARSDRFHEDQDLFKWYLCQSASWLHYLMKKMS